MRADEPVKKSGSDWRVDWQSYSAGYQAAIADIVGPRENHDDRYTLFYIVAFVIWVWVLYKFVFGEKP